jgi:hypothetical protein
MSTQRAKSCFVISPIGELGSPTRVRADLVYEFVIEEVLCPLGFSVERADKLAEPGIITNQIIDRLISSDLVIADLSERNPNVFYELAIRHAARKPYVHLIAHDEDIPFDNAAVRAIKIDVHDLRSVKSAKEELTQQVTSAMDPKIHVESPVSIAITMQDMRSSGDGEKLALSALADEVSQLKRSMSDLSSVIMTSVRSTRSIQQNALNDLAVSSASQVGSLADVIKSLEYSNNALLGETSGFVISDAARNAVEAARKIAMSQANRKSKVD